MALVDRLGCINNLIILKVALTCQHPHERLLLRRLDNILHRQIRVISP